VAYTGQDVPLYHLPYILPCPSVLHEGRERVGITGVLDPEDAEKEAVHDEHDTTPGNNSNALSLGVRHTGYLDGQGDGRKGEYTVYILCQ